ncbi:MAG TPA: DNA-binding protein, partial [Tepiditoga sp.]|nr:DNA-binding protein [Tepiditoga sp.]
EIKYLSEGKMVEITAENNIDNKIIFRYLEDLNGNKINILSFDYNEKNLKSNSVIFDESHGQTAGNADWTISTGFSDMGDQLASMGKGVYSEKAEISKDVLNMFNVLVIPEPNKPFTKEEEKIITDFVKNGGKLFLIGDHGGADRNGNGWDAVKIFNNFVGEFGFTFAGDDLEEAPLENIYKHDITDNIKEIGVWNGSSFLLKKDNIEVLIADKENKPFLILTDYYNGKIIAIGDSSPFDDGTGTSGKMLHNGWQWGDDEELSYNIFNYLTSY